MIKKASAPLLSVKQLSKYRRCYLGISINNAFFKESHLPLLLKWIDGHFDECLIIIGDYLHRLNETILFGRVGMNAVSAASLEGDKMLSILNAALSKFERGKFKIIRWQNFMEENKVVADYQKRLVEYYNSDEKFRHSIAQSSEVFIQKLIERGQQIAIAHEEAVSLSQQYLIEEMAVFTKIIEMGYQVQVYPGTQLSILKEVATGGFASLNLSLSKGIFIDLTVKKRK